MKLRDTYTKKLKCCSSIKVDEHINKFIKGCSPSSELMSGTNVSTLTKLKNYISDHPFIKYDIFEVTVKFPPRGTPIIILAQYFENHNIYYIYHSTNNIPCKRYLTLRNRTNVWILKIVRK